MTPASLLTTLSGRGEGFAPCTAEAVLALLDHYGVELDGAKVAVVGRSLVIGRPVAAMLTARNATVTTCHTHTHDLAAECRAADIVVAAVGRARTIDVDAVREGQTIIDVGINWDEAAGKLVGDVDSDAAEPVVNAITPVPGGVGAVTTAILAKHVIEAAERASNRFLTTRAAEAVVSPFLRRSDTLLSFDFFAQGGCACRAQRFWLVRTRATTGRRWLPQRGLVQRGV